MIYHKIQEAIAARQTTLRVRRYDIYEDRGTFATVLGELLHSIEDWPSGALRLIDPTNWKSDRLLDEQGRLRKPRAFLSCYLTSKDNLAMEWFPERYRGGLEESDFRRWSDNWYASQEPENRLVMIRSFGHLLPYRGRPCDCASQLLIEAVYEHVQNFYKYLGQIVELTILQEMYLYYKSGIRRYPDGRLVEVQFRDPEDVQREANEKARVQWLKQTFKEGLRISEESFLDVFEASRRSYAGTSKMFAQQGMKLSSAQVRRLVHRLHDEHPEIYRRHCSAPPSGAEARPDPDKVLQFPRH